MGTALSPFLLTSSGQNFIIALLSHLAWSLSRTGIPVKHQKFYCCATVVLKPQHASDSPARLVEIHIAGPQLQSFSLSRRPRICIFNQFLCVVNTAGPGPHFENHHRRRREAWMLKEQSLIQSIIWILVLYIFVLRQITLSGVK